MPSNCASEGPKAEGPKARVLHWHWHVGAAADGGAECGGKGAEWLGPAAMPVLHSAVQGQRNHGTGSQHSRSILI